MILLDERWDLTFSDIWSLWRISILDAIGDVDEHGSHGLVTIVRAGIQMRSRMRRSDMMLV